ncbi:hypothetical protein ES703_69207 [subsurface metagenome]
MSLFHNDDETFPEYFPGQMLAYSPVQTFLTAGHFRRQDKQRKKFLFRIFFPL